MSETSKCRERLSSYCEGMGLDIGYGGDPIVPTAITLDLPKPYTHVGDHPQNLSGDCRSLYWFKNNSLDYIYSSHLLEDFKIDEIRSIIWEWSRVIKPEGYIVLYLPDEQAYRKHCEENNRSRNANHQNSNFSLELLKIIIGLGSPVMNNEELIVVHESSPCEKYSFEIVLQKQIIHKQKDLKNQC